MVVRSAADYVGQLRALLPPGPAWEPDLNPGVDDVLRGLAPEFGRVDQRAADLVEEMVPSGVRELLPDWERVMGLPDTCVGAEASFGERRAEVVRRFGEIGAQTPEYFAGIAVRLGYPNARVVEHRAPRFGRSRFGVAHFGSRKQQFYWTLHLGSRRAGGARFGITVWGERFGGNPNDIIECVIRRYQPSHTYVIFDYS